MQSHIFQGLLHEAIVRSIQSYNRSLNAYNARVRDGLQPSTPVVNLFDVRQQNLVLLIGNSLYLLITLGLFFFMKRRQTGFRLRWLLCIYDAINVVGACYIAFYILQYKLSHSGLLLCNPITNDEDGYRLARVFTLFYIQKYFEFVDTWFFLLRKSFRQVTFLHLFHHSSITVVVGSIMPFDYNGDMYLPILLNSANHAAVYSHYLLTSLGIRSWWSPYITYLQVAQFTAIFGQSLLSYRVGPTCGSPDFAKVLMIVYMGSMMALFANFFLKRYIFQRPQSSLDLCGVIKRPIPASSPLMPMCGTVKLNGNGAAVVYLPASFQPPASLLTAGDSHPLVFLLTAVGGPMPNLHIAKELHRVANVEEEQEDCNKVSGSSAQKAVVLQSERSRAEERPASAMGRHSKSMGCLSSMAPPSDDRLGLPQREIHNDRLIDGPLPSLPSLLSETSLHLTATAGVTTQPLSADAQGSQSAGGGGRSRLSSKNGDTNGQSPNFTYGFSIAGGRAAGRVYWYLSETTARHLESVDKSSLGFEDWRTIS